MKKEFHYLQNQKLKIYPQKDFTRMFIAALFILYSNQDHMDLVFSSVQFSHSMCPALCDLVDCRTSGFPAISNHQSILTLMTPVSDAIEASRLLSSSSVHPPACNLSQHQGLFQ